MSSVRGDVRASCTVTDRWLDLALLVGALAAALDAVRMARTVGGAQTWVQIGVVATVVAVGLVRRAARRRGTADGSGRRAVAACDLVLTIPAIVTLLLPDAPLSFLYVLVMCLVLGFDVGALPGIGYAVAVAACYPIATLTYYADDTWRTVLLPTLGQLILCLPVVGVGLLLRAWERDREAALADSTALARAAARLRSASAEERTLAVARERSRSAGGLYRSLGRSLAAVATDLEQAQRDRAGNPDAARAGLARAEAANREALAQMRLWVRALDPPGAEDPTQPGSLDAIAKAFRGSGLEVHVERIGAESVPGDPVALFATRVVQEGLTNVLRHAGPGRVDLVVEQLHDAVRLRLTNDVRTADQAVDAPAVQLGGGLSALHEHAVLLGGTLTTDSRPDAFVVEAVLPTAGTTQTAPSADAPPDRTESATAQAAPSPGEHVPPGPRRLRRAQVERALDVLAVIGLLFSVLIVRAVAQDYGSREAALAAPLVVLCVLAWCGRRWSRHGARWWPLLLAVPAGVLVVFPTAGEAGILWALLAATVLALDRRLREAVVFAILVGVVGTGLAALAWPDRSGTLVVAAILLLAALCGRLLRSTEQAALEAGRRRAELELAHRRLQHTLIQGRQLVLLEERGRSARQLHDGLGHSLTLVSMALQFAERAGATDPDRAWEEVAHAAEIARTARDDVRRWSAALGRDEPTESEEPGTDVESIAASFRAAGLGSPCIAKVSAQAPGSGATTMPDCSRPASSRRD